MDHIVIEPGAIYVMDKGYVDYFRFYSLIHQQRGFFDNMAARRVYSRKVDKTTGLKYDQSVKLTGFYIKKDYPDYLRKIKYQDKETGKIYVFLTNNFELSALLIAQLYKERWKIELFFKWIKQHLRIKSFYGTSRNAVLLPDMDSNLHVSAGRDSKEKTEIGVFALHFITNFQSNPF